MLKPNLCARPKGWATKRSWFDYWLGQEISSLLRSIQRRSEADAASCSVGLSVSFPAVKWTRHKADHSPPFSAAVTNVSSYASTSLSPRYPQEQLHLYVSFVCVRACARVCVCVCVGARARLSEWLKVDTIFKCNFFEFQTVNEAKNIWNKQKLGRIRVHILYDFLFYKTHFN